MMTATDTMPDAADRRSWAEWLDGHSGRIMVLPAVIVLLCFAIFPLIISAYLALSRFALAPGGFTLKFIGLVNFRKLLVGSQQYHLLGKFGTFGFVQSAVLALIAAGLLFFLARYLWRGRPTIAGMVGRLLAAAMAMGLAALALATMAPGGVPGTVVNTLLYVFVGVSVQFALGLGLALLCGQPIRGRNFFRVLFFIPLMVTPVGIAYTFRMLADMQKGPFAPLVRAFGIASGRGPLRPGRRGSWCWSATPGSGRRSCSSCCWRPSRTSRAIRSRRRGSTEPTASRFFATLPGQRSRRLPLPSC
jgi:multiple sugar transport system permease protein